ncbi:histidinol-phosphate transaminase [Maridesulfovibrio frigidus]|uniref:histidinol-phosphate transaminase n=1 Tax=Maridesulfovibrio frigidus TaxID=340956 RepID=UPI000A67CD1A
MNNSMSHPTLIRVPRAKEQLRRVLSFVENGATCCGLGARETLSMTLAAEEIFIYLCQNADHDQMIDISCSPQTYYLRLDFKFTESKFDYRAFNLTHETNFGVEEDMLAIGLLLASRSVDQLRLVREQQKLFRLVLVKEKTYALPQSMSDPSPAVVFECEPRIATPEAIELFAKMASYHLSPELLPQFFANPGKLRDMVASGEYNCAVASDAHGRQCGGMFWRCDTAKTLECYGPYLFEDQAGLEEQNIYTGLLNSCLKDLTRTPAIGLINRYPGAPLSSRDFEELGSYSVYKKDCETTTEVVYFRQLREDPGVKAWADTALEDFLLQEYRRLVLPREVEFIRPEENKIESEYSALTTSFQREQNVVTLRPLWPGCDMEDNVARHVCLLEKENWCNISAEIDLGIPWQAAFTKPLLKHGFIPRLVLPHAGQGDVVLFRRPTVLHCLVPAFVKNFEPYIPSQPGDVLKKKYNYDVLYRLNNNENPLGPPSAALRAQTDFSPIDSAIYPSGDSYHLRLKLAESCELHPDQFIVTNGANESITLLIKSFCEPGDNIITADQTYGGYEWVARFSGIDTKLVALNNMAFDPAAMLEMRDARTKIFFICNPNNPTGTYWSTEQLTNFLEQVDERCIVVLDEAYFEFVDKPDFPDGTSLISRYPNLVILRTFSKMYGLAGLRIGYLAGDIDVVNMIRRTAIVYSVNAVAQVAAQAALGDQEHIMRTREMVASGKDLLLHELSPLGLDLVNGEGNYVVVKLPFSDSLAYRMMMQQGVMVRMMTPFRFPNCIRITVGQKDAMQACVKALAKSIKQGSNLS